jgi:hypothetical protein
VYDYVRFYEQLNPVFLDSTAINDSLKTTPNAENPQIIVDNTDAGCTFSSPWTVSSGITGFHGTNYAYYSSTSSTTWAKWTPAIPEDGNYRIFMRWAAYSNRPTAAPIEIKHMEGVSTSKVNQTLDGGKWNFLGSYQLNAGSANYVKITCSGGINTIADAVLFEKIPVETALQDIHDENVRFWINANSKSNNILGSVNLNKNSVVSLKIYSLVGTLVSEVFHNKTFTSGNNTFNNHLGKLANGIYLAVLNVDSQAYTQIFSY